MLCMNRPEGFGPSSSLSSPIPTTCFVDVVLIPLPTWIYLLLLPAVIILSLARRHSTYNPSTIHLRMVPQRSIPRTIVTVIYYLLIIANILMMVLEIVRLSLLDYGIGLLPFSLVSLLIVLATHLVAVVRRSIAPKLLIAANTFVWFGGMVMSIVQTVGLGKEYNRGETRESSKYPVSDQIIDVAVMAGVYAVLAVCEVGLGLWRQEASRAVLDERDSVEVEHLGK